jgi:hypothetical protein
MGKRDALRLILAPSYRVDLGLSSNGDRFELRPQCLARCFGLELTACGSAPGPAETSRESCPWPAPLPGSSPHV